MLLLYGAEKQTTVNSAFMFQPSGASRLTLHAVNLCPQGKALNLTTLH